MSFSFFPLSFFLSFFFSVLDTEKWHEEATNTEPLSIAVDVNVILSSFHLFLDGGGNDGIFHGVACMRPRSLCTQYVPQGHFAFAVPLSLIVFYSFARDHSATKIQNILHKLAIIYVAGRRLSPIPCILEQVNGPLNERDTKRIIWIPHRTRCAMDTIRWKITV